MSEDQANAHKQKGNEAFTAKRYTEAIEHYTRAIECNPKDHIFYSNRAASYLELKKYSEALVDATKTVELKPDFVKGHVRKGQAEFGLEQYDEAEESFQKGLELDPNNEQCKRGLEDVEKNRIPCPGSDVYTQNMLIKLLSVEKTAEWLKDPKFAAMILDIPVNPDKLDEYMRKDPRVKEAFEVLMSDFHDEEDEEPKEPIKEVTTFEEAKKAGNDAYNNGKYPEAIAYYHKAIELEPTEYMVHNNKATTYCKMKKYKLAMEEVDTAIEIYQMQQPNPVNLAKIYYRKGEIYNATEEFDKAVEYFKKSLKENKVQNVEEALQKAEKTLEEWVVSADKFRTKGNELFKNGDYDGAIREYDEGIRRNPKDAKLYSNKGTCHQKLGEPEDALRAFDAAINLDPKFVKAWSKKGAVLTSMKKYGEAFEAYAKGLDIDPADEECRRGMEEVSQYL